MFSQDTGKTKMLSKNNIFQDGRSREQIEEHYRVEKKLASRLRNSIKSERKLLYNILYNELYSCVSHHPRNTMRKDRLFSKRHIENQFKFLNRYIQNIDRYLEIGPGDCGCALAVAKSVKQVFGVDVSNKASQGIVFPKNFHLIISDGVKIDVLKNSIDVAYSNQLMEHLHPDDAIDQLDEIYKSLKIGGKYICITPHRMFGPHDISKYFDEVSSCFHLKEYSFREMSKLLTDVGFSKVKIFIRIKSIYFALPTLILIAIEDVLQKLPFSFKQKLGSMIPFKLLRAIQIVGTK